MTQTEFLVELKLLGFKNVYTPVRQSMMRKRFLTVWYGHKQVVIMTADTGLACLIETTNLKHEINFTKALESIKHILLIS
jgi:hypothetical protein